MAKFGITTKGKAELLLDQWTGSYLTEHQAPARVQRAALTVEHAVNGYISRRGSTGTKRKLIDAISGLPKFCDERGMTYLEDIELQALVDFKETRVKGRTTGEWSEMRIFRSMPIAKESTVDRRRHRVLH